ncbi:HAD hydrolase family protein [Sphingomonas sp. BIUV-7]|uniref:3-deoxy-D-manno-octulosonate 8-phosphate phosphatase KdsC n=1 Tax=Sphingomonas natans TaxID=3063330 RepID=A0ABT8Y5T8_9SPHN|nr:HAD hydrolase family protein [Sphingomonas sp. BIUV-7]MDO6413693.1 HAD hydrolase family protein [Sphingomonas sp. BIUV-7]
MIRMLVLDVDGVLTDGGLFYGPDGEQLKRFNVRDGLGIKLLQQAGVTIAIVSGRSSPALARRAAELGIAELHCGVGDKAAVMSALQTRLATPPADTAAMGDDLPDLALFAGAALRIAPADAEPELIAAADLVTRRAGGHGAVRDAAVHILALNGNAALAGGPTVAHG